MSPGIDATLAALGRAESLARIAAASAGYGRKQVFFEKKNQKTLAI
jgi:hypothetical protein